MNPQKLLILLLSGLAFMSCGRLSPAEKQLIGTWEIQTLPPDFRSLSHQMTVRQVIDEFGEPSRKIELIAPRSGHVSGGKFLAYEYELPYEAAVLVMPEPPSDENCKIRAVYFRPRADDDEFFSPVRA